MKKILTLFAMLLVTASTLLAQTPKLSYQMVVRDQNNNLVVNTEVEGTFTVTDAEDHSFTMDINAKTNHNGMLSMVVECPQTPNECGLDAIKWNSATISVSIPAYNIQTKEAVLPVPYALMAQNQDVDITTAQIVKYLKQVDTADFEALIAAMYDNPSQNPTLEKYLVDTVLNYIKANKTAVRNMMLNWLSQMNANDLDTVYKIFNANTDVKNTVNGLLVDFVEQHPQDVKDVVYFYIDHTTKGDVKAILDAVKDNPAFDTIADVIADTAIKYIKANPAKVQNVVEYYINQATPQQVDHLQSYARNYNQTTYNYVDSILDAMIQHYLDSLHYINNADCQEADICSLLENIETLENSEFVQCPVMSDVDTNRSPATNDFTYIYTLKNKFTDNTFNVNMNVGPGPDSLIYVFSYPNTTSKADTLYANYQNDGDGVSSMNLTVAFDSLLNRGQIINVYAVARARCMDILKSQTVTFNFPLQCPSIDSAWNTDAVTGADLQQNNGVELAATVNFNYPEKIADYGFLVSSENNLNGITSLNQLPEGVDVMYVSKLTAENKTNYKLNNTQSYALNENTFAQNLDMKYCARKVWYRAFVSCKTANANQGFDTTYSFAAVKKIDSVRGPEITLTANPAALYRPFDDSVSVTADGWFTIHSYTPSRQKLEDWIAIADDDYKKMLDTMYYWWGLDANNRIADGQKTIKTAPTKDTTLVGNVSVVMFGTTCTVTDSIKIVYDNPKCNDTIIVNQDTLFGPRVIVLPVPDNNDKHADTICVGAKDTLVLRASSFLFKKNNTTGLNDTTYLKDAVKKSDFYNGLVDTFSYKWTNTLKGADVTLGTADSIKVTVDRDSVVYACELTIKYKDGTNCAKTDSILIHYEFTCKDSLRTKDYAYATVEVGNACWTKSNMRDTIAFDGTKMIRGSNVGAITNGIMYYYTPSVLLTASADKLGLLYNHQAADSVCPDGWHLPTDAEWTALEEFYATNYGGTSVSQFTGTLRCDNKWLVAGNAAWSASMYWGNDPSTVTESIEVYPAGVRQIDQLVPFDDEQTYGYSVATFWAKDKSETVANKYFCRALDPSTTKPAYGDGARVIRDTANKIIGMSVRCVKGPRQEEPTAFTCGTSTVTDRDNNAYNTVKIGEQCWMKENLRTSSFADGSAIENGYDKALTVEQAYYYNVTNYGYHYNWTAVSSDKGLCPEGWNVPSENDFNQLITYLSNNNNCNDNLNNISKALAIDDAWKESGTECAIGNHVASNNSSKFSAYPAGYICCGNSTTIQNPNDPGVAACFWSSTSHENDRAYRLYLRYDNANVNGSRDDNYTPKSEAFSVRCIKAN